MVYHGTYAMISYHDMIVSWYGMVCHSMVFWCDNGKVYGMVWYYDMVRHGMDVMVSYVVVWASW